MTKADWKSVALGLILTPIFLFLGELLWSDWFGVALLVVAYVIIKDFYTKLDGKSFWWAELIFVTGFEITMFLWAIQVSLWYAQHIAYGVGTAGGPIIASIVATWYFAYRKKKVE